MFRFIIYLFMAAPFLLSAQQGTTLEEYRYLTKGYAYQKEMGLDATKEGYTIRSLFKHENGIQFLGLYAIQVLQPQAILAVIKDSNQKERYLCMPNNEAAESIKKLYKENKTKILVGQQMREKYDEALRSLVFQMASPINFAQIPKPNQTMDPYDPKLELTSKGIPVQTDRINNQPPSQTTLPAVDRPNEYSTKTVDIPVTPTTEETAKTANSNALASVGGALKGRPLAKPIVVTESHSKRGKVVIKLCVDKEGMVTYAKFTQRGSTTLDADLKEIALQNAKQARFSAGMEEEQCGTIEYHFK
ncbi:MAG: hypothetical protein AAFP19_27015 [Bacteroidota bacterium]